MYFVLGLFDARIVDIFLIFFLTTLTEDINESVEIMNTPNLLLSLTDQSKMEQKEEKDSSQSEK